MLLFKNKYIEMYACNVIRQQTMMFEDDRSAEDNIFCKKIETSTCLGM